MDRLAAAGRPAQRLHTISRQLSSVAMAAASVPAPSSDSLKVDRVDCLQVGDDRRSLYLKRQAFALGSGGFVDASRSALPRRTRLRVTSHMPPRHSPACRLVSTLTSLCMQDNYVWLLREPSGKVAVVDPSEAKPVAAALEQLGVKPDYILNTHHHWDHTGCGRAAVSLRRIVERRTQRIEP